MGRKERERERETYLAGHGELMADLTFSGTELAVEFGDGASLDTACRREVHESCVEETEKAGRTAEDVVKSSRTGGDSDEVGAAGVAVSPASSVQPVEAREGKRTTRSPS
jgi:hypothetical protein